MSLNREEMELRQVLQRYQQQAQIAQQQGNAQGLREAMLGQIEPCARLAQLRVHDYDFIGANAYLEHLRQMVDWLGIEAPTPEKNGLQARLLHTEAIVLDVQGSYDLFDKMDFVDAPVELEQAEKRYEQTAELASKLGVDRAAVQGVQGQALRVRGIRLLGQGKYNIEAADTRQAQAQLKESKKTLEQAARQLRPLAQTGQLDAQSAMYPDYCSSLAFYAQASFFRAQADESIFKGDYLRCARSLSQQIEALQQAKGPLLGLSGRVPDSLAHRLAQEIELCHKRQKHFAAEAEKQPRRSFTLGTITFVVLALGSILTQLWGFSYFNFKAEPFLYIVAVAVAFAIGGVGAGLATWGEATAFFRQMAKGVSKNKGETER